MKLLTVYKRKTVAYVTLSLTAVCTILSLFVFIRPEFFDDLCYAAGPAHVWQYVSGAFIHGIQPKYAFFLHFPMNLLGLLPIGIFLEKLLGHRRVLMLFAAAWLFSSFIFQLAASGTSEQACGISAIVYAFAAPAAYAVFHHIRLNGRKSFREPLLWYFIFECFGLITMLNPLSGTISFSVHLSGLAVGILFTVFSVRTIREETA